MPETSDARLVAGRQVLLRLRLQEDLESKLDGAASLDQAHCEMQVDLVGGCDNSSRLEVVAHTRKRLGTPLLDEFDLDVGSFLKLCRRHRCLFQRFPGHSVFGREDESDHPLFTGFSSRNWHVPVRTS